MRLENWLYTLPLRLRSLLHGKAADQDLDDEMQFHLDQLTEQNLARGMSSDEARYAAIRAMEGMSQNKERAREARKVGSVLNLGRDLRYGLRLLRQNPGFSTVAILTLALGIGANTAIFSVVNAMLLRPLPFPESDRLVRLWEAQPKNGWHGNVVNPWNFLDWREHARTFVDMAAVMVMDVNVTGQGEPFAVEGLYVSPSFFTILGIQPEAGRIFSAEDGVKDHDDKVILSHAMWQSRFGGDRQILGKTLNVNGRACAIIGVMPAGFSYPKSHAQLWRPMPIDRSEEWREGRYLTVVARLKAGVTLKQAQDDIAAAARVAAQLRPDFDGGWSAEAVPFLADITQDLRRPLIVLLAAVGFLLLIACANIANLLLMRGTARRKEIAVRQALGATRSRIVQQLLIESVILALAGMAAGLGLATLGLRGLLTLIPQSTPLPRSEPITIDAAVFAFTLLISGITAVLFGLAPALRMSRGSTTDSLKQETLQSTGGNRRLRQSLVVAEISLALLLSTGAGLMLRSFERLIATSPGFQTNHVVTVGIYASPAKYGETRKRALYVDRILDEIRNIPGVESAGTVHFRPLSGEMSGSCFERGNKTPTPASSPDARFLIVSPGYLAALQVPLLRGRDFSKNDGYGLPSVALVNQAFVKQNFHNEDPLGQTLSVCWGEFPNPVEIVGIVGDTRQVALNDAPEPTIYLSNTQAGMYFARFMVRAQGEPREIMRSLETAIHRVDPEQAVYGAETMDDLLSDSVSRPRFQMLLLVIFACLALCLATIGVYGVIAYSAGQRSREIGIRIALGAGRANVAYLITREAILLALSGIAVGLLATAVLAHALKSLLYETAPSDPVTLVLVSLIMLLSAALATYVPVRRAVKVDPVSALRYE